MKMEDALTLALAKIVDSMHVVTLTRGPVSVRKVLSETLITFVCHLSDPLFVAPDAALTAIASMEVLTSVNAIQVMVEIPILVALRAHQVNWSKIALL